MSESKGTNLPTPVAPAATYGQARCGSPYSTEILPRGTNSCRDAQAFGPLPGRGIQAFRVLAATLDMDVQELLGEALNMTFERRGLANRIEITSGRRKRD